MFGSEQIIELAHAFAGGPEFFPALLVRLRAEFDCDVAGLHVAASYPVTGGGPLSTVGFAPELRRVCARRWFTYLGELQPIARVAATSACVASDRDAFSASEQARKAYFREFVGPQGGAETLVGYLCLRQQPVAALSLGQCGGPWSKQARQQLVGLLPALSVAVASAGGTAGTPIAGVHLTAQERQVLRCVEAGLSNPEIAACCGTSVNTVRNQVASMLQKLDLCSRSQLAALRLAVFVERHD